MPLLLRGLVSLTALLLLVSGSLIALCRTQPIPESIPGLRTCEGRPCFMEVVPTRISLNEAYFKIWKVGGTSNLANAVYMPNGVRVTLHGDSTTNKLSELDLSLEYYDLRVGSLVQYFGVPCAAIPMGTTTVGLVYPGISAIVTKTTPNLHPYSIVYQLNLLDNFKSCQEMPIYLAQWRWRGFNRYTQILQ